MGNDSGAVDILQQVTTGLGAEMRDGFNRVHRRLDKVVDDQSALRSDISALKTAIAHLANSSSTQPLDPAKQPVGDWLVSTALQGVKLALVGAVAGALVLAFTNTPSQKTSAPQTQSARP